MAARAHERNPDSHYRRDRSHRRRHCRSVSSVVLSSLLSAENRNAVAHRSPPNPEVSSVSNEIVHRYAVPLSSSRVDGSAAKLELTDEADCFEISMDFTRPAESPTFPAISYGQARMMLLQSARARARCCIRDRLRAPEISQVRRCAYRASQSRAGDFFLFVACRRLITHVRFLISAARCKHQSLNKDAIQFTPSASLTYVKI